MKNTNKLSISRYAHLNKTSWCSMPWMHQFIGPSGVVKPCCRFLMPKMEKTGVLSLNNEKKLDEIFFGNFMSDIRSKMIKNQKIKGCLRCYQEETSGKKSLRERYNNNTALHPNQLIANLDQPKIHWLELALSNECNLACRMCDSKYSWKWFEEEEEFYGKTFSKQKKVKANIDNIIPFLKNIKHIKFTGGEPLMIREHLIILDKLLELGNTKNIFLSYTTNLTVKPSLSLIKKWKQFKHIEIACSFDGTGKTWEFVRYPSQWKRVEKIIRYFFQLTHEMDCRIGLRSTISVNNILGMPDSFRWWVENWYSYACPYIQECLFINPAHVTFPRFLSTTVLPKKYKDIIADKLNKKLWEFSEKIKDSLKSQINYMLSKDDSQYLPELKRYTLHFDKKRGQNFFEVNPELTGIFGKV